MHELVELNALTHTINLALLIYQIKVSIKVLFYFYLKKEIILPAIVYNFYYSIDQVALELDQMWKHSGVMFLQLNPQRKSNISII